MFGQLVARFYFPPKFERGVLGGGEKHTRQKRGREVARNTPVKRKHVLAKLIVKSHVSMCVAKASPRIFFQAKIFGVSKSPCSI